MPEAIFRKLQLLVRERLFVLGTNESDEHQRSCLVQADRLVDEILDDLKQDVDRRIVNEKSYRLVILCGYGGVYGKAREG
jgi:hypothetical protein